MRVSMLQAIIRLDGIISIKDTIRVVNSVNQKLKNMFSVSATEVDLLDSLQSTRLGVAYLIPDPLHGRSVLQKITLFLEDQIPRQLYAVEFHLEEPEC